MQIFDRVKGESVQRQRQLNAQQPLQYFFIFDYEQGVHTVPRESNHTTSITVHQVPKSTIQYRLLPVDRNIIRARFENLADKYDRNWQDFSIDIMQFALELYQDVNGAAPQSVHITELSLTANQPYETMLHNKIKWKSKNPMSPVSKKNKKLVKGGEDHEAFMYNFEPLRIRQFEIEFNKVEGESQPKQISKVTTSTTNQKAISGLNDG